MDQAQIALNQAHRLIRARQWEQARAACQSFLDHEPGNADGWADLGGVLVQLGRFGEAVQASRRALDLVQDHPTARANWFAGMLAFGKGLIAEGDPARGREVLREALAEGSRRQAPPEYTYELALLLGDWHELRGHFERELLQDSGPSRVFRESNLRLLYGELPQGWDLREARLQVPGLTRPVRTFSEPRWNGEPFPGKTLLLHFEQGFGDTFMFVRYASRVKALGGRVLLSAQVPLADVVSTCAGLDQVIPHGEPLPPFDLQLSLLSLPQVFRTGLDSIPAEIPYLDVPARVPNRKAIAEILAAAAGKVRIGLAWSGNPSHDGDRLRSLPVEALPGVAWYSFQVWGEQAAPLANLVPMAPLLENFSDTAYALTGMDLVLSVDTALAHLAGAMGIPALVLLPFEPDFRWMLHRTDSPWYPTLRLYRQPALHDWSSVIKQVLHDLT